MKNTLLFIITVISALSISSCAEQEMSEKYGAHDIRYAEHSFNVACPHKDSTATRSVMSADPDAIKDICAFAFDASSGEILRYRSKTGSGQAGDPVMAYVTGTSSFEWSLPLGVEMDIYATCNMGRLDAPADLSEFLSYPDLVYEIHDVSDLDDSGVPMTAVAKGVKYDGTGNGTFTLPARRIVSKYTLSITDMPDDYEITGIRICNVRSSTTLFAENEAADEPSELIMGDWATQKDLEALNSGGRAEFFMFENAQSTTRMVGLASGPKWFEVHGKLGDAADLCTYLDILSTSDGSSRRDRLYLGSDCRTNFDILRNTVRDITCPAPVSVMFEAGQDILMFTDSKEAAPEETVEIPFIYNLSLSEAGPESIRFTTEDGLISGEPVFYPEGDDCGTGIIPVTCSLAAPIGERLAVRMESGEADAETAVSVINKVMSVTVSAPYKRMHTMAMQLTAEALFADGSTVTDPSAFEWHVTDGVSLAYIDDGFLVRNGYVFGQVCIQASYEGVYSDELPVEISESLMYIDTEPNPIYVYENGSTTARFRACTATVTPEGTLEDQATLIAYLTDCTYSTEDPSIASASDNRYFELQITGLKTGQTYLDIAYKYPKRYTWNTDYGTAYAQIPIIVGDYQYGLVIEAPATSLYIGDKMQMKAYFVTYYKGEEKSRINVTDKVPWESSNSHASITEDGLVTAMSVSSLGTGSVSILASYNGYSASISLKIYDKVSKVLSIEPNPLYLGIGKGQSLSATLYNITNGTYDSGTDVTASVRWSSDDPDIASVNSSGYVKAISNGSTYINGTYTLYGEEYFAYIDVYAGKQTEYSTSLEITPSSADIGIGSTIDLTATHISYEDGSAYYHEDVTDWNVCFWSSSNTSVATVAAGRVTGRAAGTAIITAKYGSDTGTATIHVESSGINIIPDPVTTHELSVTADESEFTGGGSTVARAMYVTYTDDVQTSADDVTSSASWTSGNTSVATVNGGNITVNDVTGTSVVKATYNGKSDSVIITAHKKEVPEPDPVITQELAVTAGKTEFTGGGSTTAAATCITYTDGVRTSSRDVTSNAVWSTTDSNVASVSKGSIIVKDVEGKADIMAVYEGVSDSVTITAHKSDDPEPDPVITYSLTVSPSDMTIHDKGSGSFTAVFHTYADGVQTSSEDVTSSCIWSVTSGSSYVSVSGGTVTGKGGTSDGSATVKASYTHEGSTYDATGHVTYEHTVVTTHRLDVSIAETSFTGGGSTSATATYITSEDGTETARDDVTSSAIWSSSNPSVATASGGNIIVSNVDGSATITATYNGKSDSGIVSNEYVEKGTLELTWTSLDQAILVGDSTSNPALYYAEGSGVPVNVSSSAVWSSSDPSIAAVSYGTITAVGEGIATITAGYKGLSARCTVKCVRNLVIVGAYAYSISAGTDVYKVAVDLTLSNGSVVKDADYSWECTVSDNSAIVSKGDTGSGPLIYGTSGTAGDFLFRLTAFAPDGVEPESVTTGISISASRIIQ